MVDYFVCNRYFTNTLLLNINRWVRIYKTHTSRSPPSIRLLTRDRMFPDSALRLIPAHMKQSTTLIAAQYRAHPVKNKMEN